ncbi:MAG: nucleotide pyrophosphohydrolase [Xanthomonadales bacterium]|nr:nucleotide pyrophosphohydrolase [Xanthomonadales bacterium]
MLSDDLVAALLKFRADRDWEQFHTLRTLSSSIALEAAELLEVTQWVADSELEEVVRSKRNAITEEIADIAILLTYLANDLGIDIDVAVRDKLTKNAGKYPVELSKGTAKKYDEL